MQPKTERLLLGVGSLLLLLAAAIGWVLFGFNAPYFEPFLAACLRLGLVLGALWLAHPHFDRLPNPLVMLIVIVGVVLAVVRWKQMIPVAIGVVVVLMILRGLKRVAANDTSRPRRR